MSRRRPRIQEHKPYLEPANCNSEREWNENWGSTPFILNFTSGKKHLDLIPSAGSYQNMQEILEDIRRYMGLTIVSMEVLATTHMAHSPSAIKK